MKKPSLALPTPAHVHNLSSAPAQSQEILIIQGWAHDGWFKPSLGPVYNCDERCQRARWAWYVHTIRNTGDPIRTRNLSLFGPD